MANETAVTNPIPVGKEATNTELSFDSLMPAEDFPDLYEKRNWRALMESSREKYQSEAESHQDGLSGSLSTAGETLDSKEFDESPEKEQKASPIIWMPVRRTARDYFISLQKWRGVVIENNGDTFLAKLTDLNDKAPDEEVEILKSEVSEDDKKLLQPGAVFYWNIGYHTTSYGQRKRESVIRFRRVPVWRKEEIAAAQKRAQRLKNNLKIKS